MAHPAIKRLNGQSLPTIKTGYELVPAKAGKPGHEVMVHVPCPTGWCIVDHVGDPVRNIEDINHQGAPAVLNLAADQVASVPVEVSLSWWPSSNGTAAEPCLAVDVVRDVAVYGRTGALAVADQLVAFAAEVRRLAGTLPDDSPVSAVAEQAAALNRLREARA